jgi:hypothetical protein
MIATNYWNVIKTIKAVFEKIAILVLGLIWRAHNFGAKMFISTGHQLVRDKFSNAEYE